MLYVTGGDRFASTLCLDILLKWREDEILRGRRKKKYWSDCVNLLKSIRTKPAPLQHCIGTHMGRIRFRPHLPGVFFTLEGETSIAMSSGSERRQRAWESFEPFKHWSSTTTSCSSNKNCTCPIHTLTNTHAQTHKNAHTHMVSRTQTSGLIQLTRMFNLVRCSFLPNTINVNKERKKWENKMWQDTEGPGRHSTKGRCHWPSSVGGWSIGGVGNMTARFSSSYLSFLLWQKVKRWWLRDLKTICLHISFFKQNQAAAAAGPTWPCRGKQAWESVSKLMPSGTAHLYRIFFVFLRGFLRWETRCSFSSQQNGSGLATHAIQFEFSELTALPKDWKQRSRQGRVEVEKMHLETPRHDWLN